MKYHYSKKNKVLTAVLIVVIMFVSTAIIKVDAADVFRVVGSNPPNSSSSVQVNSVITINFNSNVFRGSSYSGIKLSDINGRTVPIASSINQNSLIIKPNSLLESGTVYILFIPYDAVKDLQGNTMQESYSLVFTTEYDTVPPYVISAVPASGTGNIAADAVLSIKFSEMIRAGINTANIKIWDGRGNTIPSNVSFSGDTLKIKPYIKLDNNNLYYVSIPAGSVRDRAGNIFSNTWLGYFTTKPLPDMLQIKSTVPSNGAKYIPINEGIMILFDENVYDGGNLKGITLKDSKGNIPVDISLSGNLLYIIPRNNLNYAYNAAYTVSVPAGSVKNSAGKSIDRNYVFSFTTESQSPSPKVKTADPQNGSENIEVNKSLQVYFNQSISPADNYKNIILKDRNGNVVPADLSINNELLTIKPKANLGYDSSYTYFIPYGAVRNSRGDISKGSYEFAFKTDKEKFPPKVTSSYPSVGSVNTAVDSTISIAFDEEVFKGDNFDYITLRDKDYNEIPIKRGIEGSILYINTENQLNMAYDTDYILSIPYGAVKDKVGNLFDEEWTLNFKTGYEKFSPVIKFTEPAAKFEEVPTDASITAIFSSSMNKSSNFNNIILKDSKGNNVKTAVEISGDKLVIKPVSRLLHDTVYNLGIPIDSVKDTWGNTMKSNYLLEFRTIKEKVPPEVSNTIPTNGAKLVDTTRAIEIKFNESIKAGISFEKILFLDMDLKDIPYTSTINNDTLILKPKNKLSGNSAYTIVILSGAIEDISGNTLREDYSINFITKSDEPAKNVLSITDVKFNKDYSVIGVYFNDNIAAGNGIKKILLKDSNGRTVSVSLGISKNTLVIRPKVKLTAGKKYTVIIPKDGLKGKNGKIPGSDYSYSFIKK